MLGLPLLVFVMVEPGHGEPLDPGPMREEPERFIVLEMGNVEKGLAKLR